MSSHAVSKRPSSRLANPAGFSRHDEGLRIAGPSADIEHLIGIAKQRLGLRVRKMIIEQTVLDSNEFLCVVQLEAQRSRSFDRRAHLLAPGALFIDKRLVQRNLKGQLATNCLCRIGKMFDLSEALAQMAYPFRQRKSASRTFCSLQVVVDRPVRRASLRKMPCDDLR